MRRKRNFHVSVRWIVQDFWIGAYWKRKYKEPWGDVIVPAVQRLYVGVFPTIIIVIEWLP